MKLKYLTILIALLSIPKTYAQSGYSLELNIKTIPTEQLTKNETDIGFSFYKSVNDKNKISNSINYKNTGLLFDADNTYSTDYKKSFNRLENDFDFKHSFSNKLAIEADFKTVAAYEKDLGLSDFSFFGGLALEYNLNTKNSIQIGAKRMSVFGKAQLLPTLSLFSKLSTTTSLEIGFPNSKIQYSNNERNIFSLNNTFDGEFYRLDQPKTISPNLTASKMSFSQMTTSFEYNRNIDHNWFMSFQGGYQFNKKYTLTDNRGTTKFNFDANDGYIFNIGIKYKQ